MTEPDQREKAELPDEFWDNDFPGVDDQLVDRGDEEREVAKGLDFLSEMLRLCESDTYYWKWAIVGMHNALHGCFVLALKGTWPVQLLKDDIRRKVVADQHAVDFDERVWEQDVAAFMSLYRRVMDPDEMRRYNISKALPEYCIRSVCVNWLSGERNRLLHYRSMTYVVGTRFHPQKLLRCLAVADFLLNDSKAFFWHDDQYESAAKVGLDTIRRQLKLMRDVRVNARGE